MHDIESNGVTRIGNKWTLKKLFYAGRMMFATHPHCIFPPSQLKYFVVIVDLVHCSDGPHLTHKLVCDHTLPRGNEGDHSDFRNFGAGGRPSLAPAESATRQKTLRSIRNSHSAQRSSNVSIDPLVRQCSRLF